MVALSSAEAELYAAAKAAGELLGVDSLMSDLGWALKEAPEIRTASSAARGIAGRNGLGQTRHIEVRRLWLQESTEKKKLRTRKIGGTANRVLTKTKGFKDAVELLRSVRFCEP